MGGFTVKDRSDRGAAVCGCFIARDREGMYCIGGNVRERGREGETEADRRDQTYIVASLQSALWKFACPEKPLS